MPFTATEIKDRVAIGDDKFRVETLSDGRIRLISDPDEIVEPGTDINKQLLQPIEDELEVLSQNSSDFNSRISAIESSSERIKIQNNEFATFAEGVQGLGLVYKMGNRIFGSFTLTGLAAQVQDNILGIELLTVNDKYAPVFGGTNIARFAAAGANSYDYIGMVTIDSNGKITCWCENKSVNAVMFSIEYAFEDTSEE